MLGYVARLWYNFLISIYFTYLLYNIMYLELLVVSCIIVLYVRGYTAQTVVVYFNYQNLIITYNYNN